MAARKRNTKKQAVFIGNSKAAKLAVARAFKVSKWFAGFGITIMLVSLEHLATGFADYTGVYWLAAWILALATDGGLIGAELVLAFFGPFLPDVRRYAWGIIAMVTPLSMFMNWHGFAHAGLSETMAVVLGIGLPLLILLCSKVASTLYIAAANKTA